METQFNAGSLAVQDNGTDLCLLVNRLVLGLMPAAIRNDSFIVNEVEPNTFIHACPTLSLTLHYLLNTMIQKRRSNEISVAMQINGEQVVVKLNEKAVSNESALVFDLPEDHLLAGSFNHISASVANSCIAA
jgi:hypothetical protein